MFRRIAPYLALMLGFILLVGCGESPNPGFAPNLSDHSGGGERPPALARGAGPETYALADLPDEMPAASRLAIGLGPNGEGWVNLMTVSPGLQPSTEGWPRVPWPEYQESGQAFTYPALGDIDGDGRDELVVGLGPLGEGWVWVADDAESGYASLGWFQTGWTAYDQSGNAPTRPTCADLNGDGRDEILVALGDGGEGWFAVFRYNQSGFQNLAWGQVTWGSYTASGPAPTYLAGGDLDGDGTGEVAVGLGGRGQGWVELFNFNGSLSHRGWVQTGWESYDEGPAAPTYPALGDLDSDGRADLVVGLGETSQGWVRLLKSTGTGFISLPNSPGGWVQLPWSDYITSDDAPTYPTIGDGDGDGDLDVAVGLGDRGEGWVFGLDGGSLAPLSTWGNGSGWVGVNWLGYSTTHPAPTFPSLSRPSSESPPTVKSIKVSPPVALSSPGSTRRYKAVATLSDATTQDVTAQVSWSSSHAGVTIDGGEATIAVDEPFTGDGVPVTLTATLGPASGEATLHLGTFAYVVAQASNMVSVFTIDSSNGSLTAGTAVAAGEFPTSVTVDPTGRFVYVANLGGDSISVFSIDPTTGGLTARTPVTTGSPRAMAINPTGEFLYVCHQLAGEVSVFSIDPDTGSLSPGPTVTVGSQPVDVVVDPSGRFAYVSNTGGIIVLTIDPTTGALSPESTVTISNSFALRVEAAGRFLYTTSLLFSSVSVHTIDQSTGALSTGDPAVAGFGPSWVTSDPTGRFLYVSSYPDNNVSVFAIDPTTGSLSAGTPVAGGAGPVGLATDPTGRFLYLANFDDDSVLFYTIDQTTGALTAGTPIAAGSDPFYIATTP